MSPVHEFQSVPFAPPGEDYEVRCTHRVTSVVGHVFSTDFPAQYQNWNSTDPVDLFGAPAVKTDEAGRGQAPRARGEGADVLVLWLDCDREGENIASR